MQETVVRKRVRVTFSVARLKQVVDETKYGGDYLKLATLLSSVGSARQRGEHAWFEGSVVKIPIGSSAKNFFRFSDPLYGFPCQVSMELTELTEFPKLVEERSGKSAA